MDQSGAKPCVCVGVGEVEELLLKKAEPPKEAPFDLVRKMVAEAVGTCLLVAAIIGSGIMADRLAGGNDAVALLGNTLATWGMLYVIILVFGPVSGAHFNPVVSLTFLCRRELAPLEFIAYLPMQFGGGILGAVVAHGMFNGDPGRSYSAEPWSGTQGAIGSFDGKERDSPGEFFAECVATFGLLTTILGALSAGRGADIPMAVGLYITAGYWYTSSTALANPAVTVARCFTDSFSSISPVSFPAFFGGQAVGFVVALPFCAFLFERRSPLDALGLLLRLEPKQAPASAAADARPTETETGRP